METVQAIKQRFEIIGNDPKLNRAIEKAIQVAPTDISVMVTGESGVGSMPYRAMYVGWFRSDHRVHREQTGYQSGPDFSRWHVYIENCGVFGSLWLRADASVWKTLPRTFDSCESRRVIGHLA